MFHSFTTLDMFVNWKRKIAIVETE